MKNSLQELVRRTRGRGTTINRPDFGGWVTMINGQLGPVLENSFFTVVGGNNLLDGGAGVRLWQFKCEAANDMEGRLAA